MRNLILTVGVVFLGSCNLLFAQDSAEPVLEQIALFAESDVEKVIYDDEDEDDEGADAKKVGRHEFKKVLYQVVSAKYMYKYNKAKFFAIEETTAASSKATETADQVSYKSKRKKRNPFEIVNDVKKFVEDLQRIETPKYDFILEPDTGKFQNTRLYKLGVKIVLK